MIQVLWRKDSTLYQTVHTQADFHVVTHVSHVNDWGSHRKLEILAYLGVDS